LKNLLTGGIIFNNIKQAQTEFANLGILTRTNFPSNEFSLYCGGGLLELVVCPTSVNQLIQIVNIIKKNSLDYLVIGACGNTLIKDTGFSGVTIMTQYLKGISHRNNTLYAGAGDKLNILSKKAMSCGLSGFEPLTGIPASVGGACVMNAGAFGTEMSQLIKDITYIDFFDSRLKKTFAGNLPFKYRHTNGFFDDKIITSVSFKLTSDDTSKIKARCISALETRKLTQPSKPSLGCVFKKAKGISAGYYIEKAGLKGFRIGGAQISQMHANFIVNTGNGNASNYIRLVEISENQVLEKFNIKLEREIIVKG
jgi:UDP-N-acetylmuramate dehydrogenase